METFFRHSRTITPRISPLAVYDGSVDVKNFIKEFALRPAEEFHVLNRPLALVIASIASADGAKVRVLTGTLYKQAKGPGHWTLVDEDGFILGRSLNPRQVVGWSADPADQLEASAMKALEKIRYARWDREQAQLDADEARDNALIAESIEVQAIIHGFQMAEQAAEQARERLLVAA